MTQCPECDAPIGRISLANFDHFPLAATAIDAERDARGTKAESHVQEGQTPHCLRLRRSFSEIPSPQSLLDGSSGLLRCGPRRSAVLAPVLREPYCRQATFSQSAHSCVGPLASRAGAAAAAAAAALAALREVTSSSRSPAASPSSPSAQRASRRATTMRLGDRLRGWWPSSPLTFPFTCRRGRRGLPPRTRSRGPCRATRAT